ncbi:hypothetical protein B0H14DRAFT_2627429 [Mycena olivaceomarginata]|nr:hypothetical protein B0H14DRAFT_2627429 [Mycena olivaceomarginata]
MTTNNLKKISLVLVCLPHYPLHSDSQEQHQVGPGGIARVQQQFRVPRWNCWRRGGMNWKGSSLSNACLIHSVVPERSALLWELSEQPLLCTPAVLLRMPGAFFCTLASREAEAMVEAGGSAERLSQQLELVPVAAAGSRSRISYAYFGAVVVESDLCI